MCGIAGTIACGETNAIDWAMLSHRGPDDIGVWSADAVHLYHWRLSIIDLSPAGHQPMVSRCGRYVICYNGEVYNCESLRKELAAARTAGGKPLTWRGHSDTEVILEGAALWGTGVLARLNGMFALALYDQQESRLYLARDRVGIKPLYLWQPGEAKLPLAFASEAKFFHQVHGFELKVHAPGLTSFFTYGHGYAANHVMKDVRQVRPGELLTVDVKSGESVSSSYIPAQLCPTMDFAPGRPKRGGADVEEKQAVVEIRRILTDAVQRQLVADVPVGVFLSGGVDSSILTTLTARFLGAKATKAFTLGYAGFGVDFNEVEEARAIAKHLGVQHFVYEATSQDLIDSLEAMVWHYDEPFGDAAALNMMVLSRLVRSEVTVALAGEGSDELFGGYRRYQVERLIRSLGPMAAMVQAVARRFGLRHLKRVPRRAAILLRSVAHATAGRRYSAYFESGIEIAELIRPEWQSSPPFDPRERLEELYPDDLEGTSPVAALCHADQKFWLVDAYLEKSDKGAMAHSLEVRVPFLDNEVIEFANRLPDHLRIRGRQGKWLLKEAFKDLVPERVFTRRKRGFSVPLAHWFRHDLKTYFAEQVLSPAARSQEYLRKETVECYFDEHAKGLHDRSLILWYCLIFEIWLRLVEHGFAKPSRTMAGTGGLVEGSNLS